jgi:hypothetical protein
MGLIASVAAFGVEAAESLADGDPAWEAAVRGGLVVGGSWLGATGAGLGAAKLGVATWGAGLVLVPGAIAAGGAGGGWFGERAGDLIFALIDRWR